MRCPNYSPLGRQSLARDQLAERGINAGRNPKALKFLVNYGRHEDVLFIEQILSNDFGVGSFDLNVGDGARLIRVKRSVETNLGHILEPVHPVTGQVTQPRFFAFATNGVVKQQRLANGQFYRRRVCANLFELADVRRLIGFRGKASRCL